jgi:hypothetical protein
LPISERPRERLSKYGAEVLSLQEILALTLGRGIAGESVITTDQRILTKFGNLKNLASASIEELSKIKGVDLAKAAQIKAAFELGRRKDESSFYELYNQTPIKSSEDVVNLVKNKLKGKKKEYFLVLLLSTRNKLKLILLRYLRVLSILILCILEKYSKKLYLEVQLFVYLSIITHLVTLFLLKMIYNLQKDQRKQAKS